MLPISLTLRNFLSYRDSAPPLRLEQVHVACLCGPNGHGKSALLDAITWALWGRARGQRQEQLLHHGQDEMSVELEFDTGGARYRVTRRYSRARRSAQSSLELAVASGEEYRPITGDTITATQAHISRLINMDYETFVNSAFLVQGRADLFAMATPSQRKDVLSRVLGLGLYERLEERAKGRGRDAQARLQSMDGILDRLREQAARCDHIREALGGAQTDLADVQRSASTLAERLELLRRQLGLLEGLRAEAAVIETQAQRVAARKAEAARDAAALEQRLARWRQALARADETTQGFAALTRARERLLGLQAAAQAVHALERELFPLEQAVTAARAGLQRDIASQRKHIAQELKPRAESQPGLESALAQVVATVSSFDTRFAEVATLEEQGRALSLEAKGLEQENARLTELGKETRAKLDLLTHDHAEGAACPLCGTELGAEGRVRVRQNYEQEISRQRALFRNQTARAKQLVGEADTALNMAAERSGALEDDRRRLGMEAARLNAQVEDARRAAVQLDQASRVLAEHETALAQQSYASSEQTRAEELRSRIAVLAFDTMALAICEQEARDCAPWEAAHQALTEARARHPEDEAAHQAALARIRDADEEASLLAQRSEAARRELADLPTFQRQEQALSRELAEVTARRDALQARCGSLSAQLQDALAAATEVQQRETARRTVVEEAAAYAELALAFGKGGVQALLIEAAIPRLEDEANDLLNRMTGGRMSLKLETQRQRRTRGAVADAIETLEIHIADEIGTRAYEMFSGGERFRIDFALRIALSKLLAWRAGAPLPTLFIDEGFGTQDAEGRDRILDVIKAIEDRFQRILVITHMDEIKEAFPVRIEVSRLPGSGSTFSIM